VTGEVYSRFALEQIPRLLGSMDRNPMSPSYGCMHRDYWLYKTSDFPDAVRQFGVHALALAWAYPFSDNPYQRQPKVLEWIRAALAFWTSIQHRDGSFDEFYPYERGWVGPSAFTTYASAASLALVGDELPADDVEAIRTAVDRAAAFIATGDQEEDHLANHHAMACLAVHTAAELLDDDLLRHRVRDLWRGFLTYHTDEGWSREYDGIDPGYLSATVSFLGKIWERTRDEEILRVLRESVEISSYFVFPNGAYAGSMGSRNTLHFYPHGYEILAAEMPTAAAVADRMRLALSSGNLVPPSIMSDRYSGYRVPEFLLAALAHQERAPSDATLPCEGPDFSRQLPEARIWVEKKDDRYRLANLAKGGVYKEFAGKRLAESDCGIVGVLEGGRIVTSQWIADDHDCRQGPDWWEVSGQLCEVTLAKRFTPVTHILFRLVLIAIGWSPRASHALKGWIRRRLILKQRQVPVWFRRSFRRRDGVCRLSTELEIRGPVRFARLMLGDEFFVRYVPQSMFFQRQELETSGEMIEADEIAAVNASGRLVRTRSWRTDGQETARD